MTNADRGPFTFDIVERDRKVVYECHLFFQHCVHFTLHPGRLTRNIIIEVGKIIFLSKWVGWMFHVNLPGCICIFCGVYEVCDESVCVCVRGCVCVCVWKHLGTRWKFHISSRGPERVGGGLRPTKTPPPTRCKRTCISVFPLNSWG